MRARHNLLPTVLSSATLLACLAGPAQGEIEPQAGAERRVERRVMVIGDGGEASLVERLPHVRRAFLGIEPIGITPELRRHFGSPEDAGVLIGRIVDGSPAFTAGLAVGDVVSRVDGEKVTSPIRLRGLIAGRERGEEVTLQVWRNGEPLELSVVLDETERSLLDVGPLLLDDDSAFHRVIPLGEEGEIVIRRDLDQNLFEVEIGDEENVWRERGLDSLLRGTLERRGLDDERIQRRIEELDRRLEELAEALERLAADEERQ